MIASVEEIVQRVTKLPTISSVAFEVIQLCADREIPIPRMVKVISGDQSLTAQILRVANSSFFNYPRTIYSLDRAIVILGFNLLRDIAVSLSVYSIYKGFRTNSKLNLKSLWKHALDTSFISKLLADEYDIEHKDLLYIAGLLHDIGKLAMLLVMEYEYLPLLHESISQNKSIYQLEKNKLNLNHAEVGAELLKYWKLPDDFVPLVCYHHEPALYLNQDNNGNRIKLLYFGNLCAHLIERNQKKMKNLIQLDPEFEHHFSLSEAEFLQIINKVEQELEEERDYINIFETDII